MHSTNLPPAGKGVLLESLADGEYVRTKVVEPVAVRLVDEGVYSGYSVGISRPRIDRDVKARNGRIVAGKIVEISLVDRPALPTAKFAVLKSDGNGLAFIGKSVTIPSAYRPAPEAITRYQRGAHVTIHARDTMGDVRAYEGKVTRTGIGSVEIDTTGFNDFGRRERFTDGDIVAAYKGSAPDLVKGEARDEAGFGSTEDSVGDGKGAVATAIKEEAAPAVVKVADCDKCKGSGQFGEANCDKCAGSGKAEIVKGADMASITEDIGDIKEDIKDLENDIEDVSGVKADKDDKDEEFEAPEEEADEAEAVDDSDGGDEEAAPKFGEGDKVAKRARVEQKDGHWVVLKGTEVLGTHGIKQSAEAHRDAYERDRKAAKVARKAAKVAAATLPKGTDEVPWLLRRAHDFTCPVYKTASVEEFYPSIEKSGVNGALNASTRNAVFTALAGEVGADAGTGSATTGIYALGKSMYGLQAYLTAEEGSADGFGAATVAARDELHEAFKEANPEIAKGEIPQPSESITPGQFNRPYLSAGHQKETASGSAAHIPETTHPISASDFSRGPLADGHQRYLKGALADIHDGLSAWKPDLCRMSPMDAAGSFASERQPGLPLVGQLPNGAANSPAGMPGFAFNPASAPVAKALTEEDLAAIVTKAMQPALEKITSLQEEVDRLGSQPDPIAAANRGIVGADIRKVAKVSEANEAQQEAARGKRAEKVDYLQGLARNGSPEQRIAAQERLNRLGVSV